MMKLRFFVAFALIGCVAPDSLALAAENVAGSRPNIVFMLADDMGRK